MVIPSFSTDAIIIAAMGLVVVYSFLAGQQAMIRLAISVYVGIVLALSFGDIIYDVSKDVSLGGFGVSEAMVKIALLALPIVILQIGHYGGHRHTHMLATALVAVATSLLLVSSVLEQLDAETLSSITEESNLASFIHSMRLWWVAAVPAGIAIEAFLKMQKPRH